MSAGSVPNVYLGVLLNPDGTQGAQELRFLLDGRTNSEPEMYIPILPNFHTGEATIFNLYFMKLWSMNAFGEGAAVLGGTHQFETSSIGVRLRKAGNNIVYSTGQIIGPLVTPVTNAVTRIQPGVAGTQFEIQRVRFSDPNARGTIRITVNPPGTIAQNNTVAVRCSQTIASDPIRQVGGPWSRHGLNYGVGESNGYDAILTGTMGFLHHPPFVNPAVNQWRKYNSAGAVTGGPDTWYALFDPDIGLSHTEFYMIAYFNYIGLINGFDYYDNGFDMHFWFDNGNGSADTNLNSWVHPLPLMEVDSTGYGQYRHAVIMPPPAPEFWLASNGAGYLEILIGGQVVARQELTDPPPPFPPTARFWAHPTTQAVDGSIQFTDKSVRNPLTWAWDFGDGTTSFVQNPTHSYSTPGHKTVSLTVSNNYGYNRWVRESYITISGAGAARQQDRGSGGTRSGLSRFLAPASGSRALGASLKSDSEDRRR